MPDPAPIPYKLACLCDLRDKDGRILLLRRLKEPNKGLCSPIGGKLDMATGESPAQCARREIMEEAGIDVPIERLHLMGLISEAAFNNGSSGRGHWLLFYYRVMGAVWVEPHDIREGRLEWYKPEDIWGLPLPETDRRIIWPLVQEHEAGGPGSWGKDGWAPEPPGFFTVHIDCTGGEEDMRAVVEQSRGGRDGRPIDPRLGGPAR